MRHHENVWLINKCINRHCMPMARLSFCLFYFLVITQWTVRSSMNCNINKGWPLTTMEIKWTLKYDTFHEDQNGWSICCSSEERNLCAKDLRPKTTWTLIRENCGQDRGNRKRKEKNGTVNSAFNGIKPHSASGNPTTKQRFSLFFAYFLLSLSLTFLFLSFFLSFF